MSYPYNVEALHPYEWVNEHVPPVAVDPHLLTPTQDTLMIRRLVALYDGCPPEGPDLNPHVVELDGRLYVHNGHHRWILALLAGTPLFVRSQPGTRVEVTP